MGAPVMVALEGEQGEGEGEREGRPLPLSSFSPLLLPMV